MLDCIITVKGTGVTRTGGGNTTRPVKDTTRPVSSFFKAFYAYGRAVRDHIRACDRCTPEAALPFLKDAPSVFGRENVIRHLIRNDARTPRLEYFKILNPTAQSIAWAALFGSGEELWATMRHVTAHWAPRAYRYEWTVTRPTGAGWRHERLLGEGLSEGLNRRVSGPNRDLVGLAQHFALAKAVLPATPEEARELLPALVAHAS